MLPIYNIKMNFNIHISQLDIVADSIIKSLKPGVVLLDASMGCGKTTLISALCKKLGVQQKVNSPTFAIIQEYLTNRNTLLAHADLYRLKTTQDAIDAGIESLWLCNKYEYIFIEWPQIVNEILPHAHTKIEISYLSENERNVKITQV